MSEPRASTDAESAPLLARSSTDRRDENDRSFLAALTHPTRPLTNLEKLLAGAAVLFLVLTGTFVGLFAGAEVALKKARHGGGSSTLTETYTATKTQVKTSTAPGTTVTAVPTGKPQRDICLTPDCVRLSASILESLNTSTDPCDDFYEFANGGWLASHDIPADRGVYGSFNEVSDRNKKVILKVLDSISDKAAGGEVGIAAQTFSAEEANRRKLKAVYASCLNVDKLNELGIKPLLPLVQQTIDIIGPFDALPPVQEGGDIGSEPGKVDRSYTLPDHLEVSAARTAELKRTKAGRVGSQILKKSHDIEDAGDKHERSDKITQALAWLHSRGVDALVNFEIEGDAGGEDSQRQSLWLYQAFGGLPAKEYYEEKPVLDLYTSVVTGILTDIAEHTHSKDKRDLVGVATEVVEQGWPWPWPGDDKPNDPPHSPEEEPLEKRMTRLADKVVKFERELVRAGAGPEYLFNPHFAYNPYPAGKVDKALPFLSLPTYLATTGIRAYPANITVTHPPYLKAVSKIVEDAPDYVLSGYFVTRLALVHGSALGSEVRVKQEIRRLNEVLRGLKKGTEEDRVDVCLSQVDDIVGFIAGREFVNAVFSADAKADGEQIIDSIVSAFHDKLPHVKWMDSESAAAAQKKAKAILPKVGYPLMPDTTNPESLQSWYARLEVDEDDFFGNVVRSTVLQQMRTWSGLGMRRDRRTWEMYPQTVNAYYSPPDGEIVFPAGILQPPFYSHEWPAHLKYGAFGMVAAHELTHAFDNSGSQYDEHGRLREWWTNTTTRAFEERAQCIAKQYSTYTIIGPDGKAQHVNGNLTNGEDIADSGIAQAFAAWRNSIKDAAPSLQLPGLDFTDEQLFFISFARIWEQLARPATAVVRLRTDPHSPPYWRVMGALKNLPEFHEAFKCKSGSRMNPPKKEQCELW